MHLLGRVTGHDLTMLDTYFDGVIVLTVWMCNLALLGTYEGSSVISAVEEFRRLTHASVLSFLITSTIAYMTKSTPARSLALLIPIVGLTLISIGRFQIRRWDSRRKTRGVALMQSLVIGDHFYATSLMAELAEAPHLGFHIVGTVTPRHSNDEGTENSWVSELIARVDADEIRAVIIQAGAQFPPELVSKISWALIERPVQVYVAPTFLNLLGPRLEMRPHPSLALISLEEPKLSFSEKVLKRIFDIVFGTLGLIITFPIMVVIGFVIWIKDPGPVFFTQDRVGLSGELFRFIKFRTMVVGADKMRQDVLGMPDDEMVNRYKDDPRILPFGRVLRRYSLDELPQLLSVVLGKMSLVGPRPLLVEELTLLDFEEHRRHLTKPGLTGLWQISGRKETTWDERIRLDLNYIHDWSIGFDLSIIFRTIFVIVSGKGSY